jgi:dihydrofolate reductase
MINMIVAISRNMIIGRDNELPWGIVREDRKHFKDITTGHTVVMGRKTYESIGRPLPDRRNIVLSHKDIKIPGVEVVHSVNDILLLDCENPDDDIFIIGGGWVYREFLDYTKRIFVTKFDEFFDGDTYFPADRLTRDKWVITDETYHVTQDKHYSMYFSTLERIDI